MPFIVKEGELISRKKFHRNNVLSKCWSKSEEKKSKVKIESNENQLKKHLSELKDIRNEKNEYDDLMDRFLLISMSILLNNNINNIFILLKFCVLNCA